MSIEEVVWFINHKYGEQAALEDFGDLIKIYTNKSTWLIHKNDFKKFGCYELFHANQLSGNGYHSQMHGRTIPYLVYHAIMHDNPNIFSTNRSWDNFKEQWERYQLGQSIWKKVCEWDEICAYESYMRGEYD